MRRLLGRSAVRGFEAGGERDVVISFDLERDADALEIGEVEPAESGSQPRGAHLVHAAVFIALPLVIVAAAGAAGYLKWQLGSIRDSQQAMAESVRVAGDATTKILSYQPDTVDQDLGSAADLLTGQFRDTYTSLTHDVVIPGAKQKKVAAVATIAGAAPVEAGQDHAVVLVFVNQTTTVGNDPPTNTASSVKVTLDKQGGRWLVSGFDPV